MTFNCGCFLISIIYVQKIDKKTLKLKAHFVLLLNTLLHIKHATAMLSKQAPQNDLMTFAEEFYEQFLTTSANINSLKSLTVIARVWRIFIFRYRELCCYCVKSTRHTEWQCAIFMIKYVEVNVKVLNYWRDELSRAFLEVFRMMQHLVI